MTIAFGILKFILCNVIMLRGSPSRIPLYFVFPGFVVLVYTELLYFLILGGILWASVLKGNLKLIKLFPCLLLFNYIITLLWLIELLTHGSSVAKMLTLSDFGMPIKLQEREEGLYKIEAIILYTLMSVLMFSSIVFCTYLMILALSWIDKLEIDIENEECEENEEDIF